MAMSGTLSCEYTSRFGGSELTFEWSAADNYVKDTVTLTVKVYLELFSNVTLGTNIDSYFSVGTYSDETKAEIKLNPSGLKGPGKHLLGTLTKSYARTEGKGIELPVYCTVKTDGYYKGSTFDSNSVNWIAQYSNYGQIKIDAYKITPSFSISGTKTLGVEQTVNITPAHSSFTHTVRYKCGNAPEVEPATKTADKAVKFTPPISLAQQNTTGTSVTITVTVHSYSDGSWVASKSGTYTYTIPASVAPKLAMSVTDAMGLVSKYGKYIYGESKFKITLTPTIAEASPISAYSVVANGERHSKASVTTDFVRVANGHKITASVTDGRSRSASASQTVNIIPYAKPLISQLKVKRCDADGKENSLGQYVGVTFSATISDIENQNSASFELQYKKTSVSTYEKIPLDGTNGTVNITGQYSVVDYFVIFEADGNSAYDVIIVASDDFYDVPRYTVASTAAVMMHWNSTGTGFGIGKLTDLSNTLDVGYFLKPSGGFINVPLVNGADLNNTIIPNTYYGKAADSSTAYLNCPITDSPFVLEVMTTGTEEELLQRITACDEENPRMLIRYFIDQEWGEWKKLFDMRSKVLWDKYAWHMVYAHEAELSEPISAQANGIVLIFSYYNEETKSAEDWDWHSFFVPKFFVNAYNDQLISGSGMRFFMTTGNFATICTKYLYIYNNKIKGHDNNNLSGTASGITYNNAKFVLRYVIGV